MKLKEMQECEVYCFLGYDKNHEPIHEWKEGYVKEIYRNGRMAIGLENGRFYDNCDPECVRPIKN